MKCIGRQTRRKERRRSHRGRRWIIKVCIGKYYTLAQQCSYHFTSLKLKTINKYVYLFVMEVFSDLSHKFAFYKKWILLCCSLILVHAFQMRIHAYWYCDTGTVWILQLGIRLMSSGERPTKYKSRVSFVRVRAAALQKCGCDPSGIK